MSPSWEAPRASRANTSSTVFHEPCWSNQAPLAPALGMKYILPLVCTVAKVSGMSSEVSFGYFYTFLLILS